MKKFVILSFLVFTLICLIFLAPQEHTGASTGAVLKVAPISARAAKFAETPALRALHAGMSGTFAETLPRGTKVLNLGRDNDANRVAGLPSNGEPESSLAEFGGGTMPVPSLSFDGIANIDNAKIFGLLIIPPDMNGDIGPSHYVQAVNSLLRVYSKNGSPITPPIKLSDVFAPLNTPCSERNDGLPNVLYDPLADRWLISQVCSNFPPFRQMVAVSKTADPAGQYFLYEFVMPNVKINDFPKFGVWPDGYYMTTDEFLGSDYVGSGMFAYDRAKMLVGDPSAAYIYFNRPVANPIRRGGMLPADIDGLRAPAAGTPALFASYTATEYGDANDAIRLFDFHANFADPARSTFTERVESPVMVAAFDPTSPAGRQDISQPPPGEFLDSVSDRLNHRLAYRNFDTHESLTVNQTVRITPVSQTYRAGVRVYELRRTGGGYSPVTQTTVGEPGGSRWIGAVAQDHQGNIAVEYNHVQDDKQPSIRYSGRLAGDPPGIFRPEGTLVEGTGVQKAFGWRWGEYSGMTVDPVDDCTFWMTNAYYTLESQMISDFTWLTRIGRFKFAECTSAPRSIISGTVTNAVNGLPIANAVIRSYPYSRTSAPNGSYGPVYALPGTYEITASARGFRGRTFVVTVVDGQELVRDFALEPVAVLESTATEIINESCRMNSVPEPGETVTMNISLRNTGAAPTQNLIATLLSTGGVTNPGPAQTFGAMPTGGPSVTRPFTFTVSAAVSCGDLVSISLQLSDGSQPLGILVISLRTGEPRVAYSENFDRAFTLPRGWITSASEGHQLWRLSSVRSQSPPNSLYSPAPHQMGVNQVVSPPFHISSPTAEVSFRNWYHLETTFLRNRLYDGSVLELKIGGGDWQDILAAGGTFVSGGYDGTIDGCCQNPLAGRLGWSGRSGVGEISEFITSRAKLPAAAADRDVRLRFRIGTDIGGAREGQYIDNLSVTDGYSCGCAAAAQVAKFDFDGDGRTDHSVYDLSSVAGESDFRFIGSADGSTQTVLFGNEGDVPSAADFDGDGKTDFTVFRASTGTWYILNSSDGTLSAMNFGLSDDVPVPADFDGDRRADVAVFRPGGGHWFIARSSDGQNDFRHFGISGDRPVPEDYDGDGKADIAVFRPASGVWYVLRSSNGSMFVTAFGQTGDTPVAGDFDGDGRADTVVFRHATGVWYMDRTLLGFGAVAFGLSDDKPLQADFDGDGKFDVSVFRPSTRDWYHIKSSDGSVGAMHFGEVGESALPAIYTAP